MNTLWLLGILTMSGGNFDRQIPLANNQANELFEQQDYQGALDAYLSTLQKERDNGALAYNIANTYSALGDQENAAKFYEKAMQSDDAQARQLAQFNLGNLEMARQKPKEAMNHYIDYLKNQPNDIDAKRNLELALRQMQQQNQQNQNQENQDQENQDEQQDQQQQQQSSGQDQQDQQDQQEQKQQQDQQNQDENQQQSQGQQQEQQNQENQQSQQDKPEEKQEDQKQQQQQQQQQQQEKAMDEQLKKQILDALNEQELQQQKAYQQRQIGKVKRRSKDW